jgi:CHAD domain-containing protein
MPGDNFILRHWKEEVQFFHKNFVLLQDEINATAVHDLRVAVKKLRSYLKLCAIFFNTKDAERLFAGTEELFSVLGKHRNLEMSKKIVNPFLHNQDNILTPLLRYFQFLQDQVRPHCQRILSKYEEAQLIALTNLLERKFRPVSEQEMIDKIKARLKSSVKTIRHELKDFENRNHRVRKHLKDIFYWLETYPPDFAVEIKQLKAIDKILGYLGNVQDLEVLKASLKTYRKTILANAIAEYTAKKIEIKLAKKKSLLLQKAFREIGDLLDKHKMDKLHKRCRKK